MNKWIVTTKGTLVNLSAVATIWARQDAQGSGGWSVRAALVGSRDYAALIEGCTQEEAETIVARVASFLNSDLAILDLE